MSLGGENYGKAYQERVQRLFSRVNNIQNLSKEEKKIKIQDLELVVTELRKKIQSQSADKENQNKIFNETFIKLKEALDLENKNKDKFEQQIQQSINKLEKDCNKILEESKLSRDETDTNLVNRLNQSIDVLQAEISKNLVKNSFNGQEEIQQVLEIDLPKINFELANEQGLRKDLEQKIMEQFRDQLDELNQMYLLEKQTREEKEEEILNGIQTISEDIENSIRKQKEEREKNEENILELIEKVIERLKDDSKSCGNSPTSPVEVLLEQDTEVVLDDDDE